MPRRADPLVVAAARDNAAWCAAMCRAHGIASRIAHGFWVAEAPTPDGYPAAVTLAPGCPASTLVGALPAGATSVKDSFADLDLAGEGFRVLFEARWIARRPGRRALADSGTDQPPREWSPPRDVSTAGELEAWASAHGGGATFAPALLDEADVEVLAAGEPITGGGVLTRTGGVVGLSNVFGGASGYAAIAEAAARRYPDRTIVGWEADDAVADATAAGFHAIGPLRVWSR